MVKRVRKVACLDEPRVVGDDPARSFIIQGMRDMMQVPAVSMVPTKPDPVFFRLDRDGITQSLLTAWQECRQKAAFILAGWERPESKRSLEFGSLFHYFLENYYADSNRWRENVEEFVSVFGAKWLEKQRARGIPGEHTFEDLAVLHVMLPAYVRFWHDRDSAVEWLELEGQFDETVLVEGVGSIRLRGKRDGIFRVDEDGSSWLFETKTRSRIDNREFGAALSFNFQNLFYLTAHNAELARKKLTGRLSGVEYNVLRKPGFTYESTEELIAKLKPDVKKRPEHYFFRYTCPYSKERQEGFLRQLKDKLVEFDAWTRSEAATYRSECSCVSKYTCPFLDACAAGNLVGFTKTRTLFSELEGD